MGGGEEGVREARTHPEAATSALDRGAPALLGVVAVLLALVATWRGPGLTDDSVNYLSTSINIAESRGWVMLADQPLTIFPPGLPAIGAVGEVVGIGAETTLRLVSAVSFGAIVLLGHRLLRQVVSHRGVVLGATVLLAVSPALLGVAKMAWSEPLFIVLCLLFLLALGRVLERGVLERRELVELVVLGGLAVLVRYIGVSLIALAGIAMIWSFRPLDRRAWDRIGLFGLLSAVVPIGCILRNRAADGTELGKRIPSQDTFADSGYRILVTLGDWVYPASGLASRTLALLGTAAVLVVVLGLVAAVRSGRRAPSAAAGSARIHLLCCVGFVLTYVAYLVAASLRTAFEPINSRYLSPVYVPVVVIAAAGLATVLGTVSSPAVRRALGALPVLFIALLLITSVDDARTGAADGIGHNTAAWVDSELASAAADLVDSTRGAVVYSNQPFSLWAGTRMQPIRWAPLETGFRGAEVAGELEALARQVACAPETTFLVRYRFGSPRVFSNEEIRTVVKVQRRTVTEDGAIFQLTPKRQVRCAEAPARPTFTRG